MTTKFKVPGVIWSALLIAGAALIQANVEHNTLWFQLAMVLIAALLKGLDVNFGQVLDDINDAGNIGPLDPSDLVFSRGLSPAAAKPAPSTMTSKCVAACAIGKVTGRRASRARACR